MVSLQSLYYTSLCHAKWSHNKRDMESYWGFLLNMGSIEGNIHVIEVDEAISLESQSKVRHHYLYRL